MDGDLRDNSCLQVVASWNLTGLDEATADRLFEKVKAQTLAGPQPESLKMTYVDEWLLANVLAGSVLVDDPKACIFCPTVEVLSFEKGDNGNLLMHMREAHSDESECACKTFECCRESPLMGYGRQSRWWMRLGGDTTQRMRTYGL
jgi:hypothetical protein